MPPEDLPGLSDLCAEVAAAARALAAAGLVLGASGNLSARHGDHVAVTPTGARLARVQADEITVVDLDGGVVGGSGLAPTSEIDLHLGAYRRFGSGAVIHTHSPQATALACVLEEVPCIHYGMLALGGDIRVAPYRTFGTPELAEVTLAALEGKAAALMASHGAIVLGADIAQACEQAELLEWACGLYVTATRVGTPHVLDAAERSAVVAAVTARRYGAMRPAQGSPA